MTVAEETSATTSSPPFKYLVVDAGPLIANEVGAHLAEELYTVPEVVAEIRDAATRDRLSRSYQRLKLRNPSPQALQQVREFAKATGDAASLSVTDLKVVALTLTLELEANGDKSHALTAPDQDNKLCHSRRPERDRAGKAGTKKDLEKGTVPAESEKKSPAASAEVETVKLPAESIDAKSPDESVNKPQGGDGGEGEWITTENFDHMRAKAMGVNAPATPRVPTRPEDGCVGVGCVSTDFAVQNLLLQMRLGAYGPDGYRIRRARNWLLRCHACYWTTRQMDRRFCDKCGNPTLRRVPYMIDGAGTTHLFLRSDYQHRLRGTNAPLPPPRPGRGGNNVLLREDQKEYKQAMKDHQRQEKRANAHFADINAVDDRLAVIFGGMKLSDKGAGDSHNSALPPIGFAPRRRKR